MSSAAGPNSTPPKAGRRTPTQGDEVAAVTDVAAQVSGQPDDTALVPGTIVVGVGRLGSNLGPDFQRGTDHVTELRARVHRLRLAERGTRLRRFS